MKTAFIIVSYNSSEDIQKLSESIEKQIMKPDMLIIVDNQWTLEERNKLKIIAKKYWFKLILSDKNWWFAYWCNIWIKNAFELWATHIWLINPDAILKDVLYLKKIEEEFLKWKYSIFWTYVRNIESKEIEFWWAKLWFFTLYPHIIHRWEMYVDNERDIEETTYATGSSLFFTKELYISVWWLDESYFMYFEETDFCLRAKKKWYKIWILPSTFIDHNTSSSVGRMSWFYVKYMIRNFLKFALNQAKWYQIPWFIIVYSFFWVPWFLYKYNLLKKWK